MASAAASAFPATTVSMSIPFKSAISFLMAATCFNSSSSLFTSLYRAALRSSPADWSSAFCKCTTPSFWSSSRNSSYSLWYTRNVSFFIFCIMIPLPPFSLFFLGATSESSVMI